MLIIEWAVVLNCAGAAGRVTRINKSEWHFENLSVQCGCLILMDVEKLEWCGEWNTRGRWRKHHNISEIRTAEQSGLDGRWLLIDAIGAVGGGGGGSGERRVVQRTVLSNAVYVCLWDSPPANSSLKALCGAAGLWSRRHDTTGLLELV